MFREMLKSKIHRAKITDTNMHYSGSIGIDKSIMEKVDILEGEKVHVLNLNNGERIETYAIPEKRGSKDIKLYGPAARKGQKGDIVSILCYAFIDDKKAKKNKAKIVVF